MALIQGYGQMYVRLRRLLSLAIAHALLDGASALIGVLLPALKM